MLGMQGVMRKITEDEAGATGRGQVRQGLEGQGKQCGFILNNKSVGSSEAE